MDANLERMPETIAEYDIISGETFADVVQSVQVHINEGWEPFGNIAIDPTRMNTRYNQPIVRKKAITAEKFMDSAKQWIKIAVRLQHGLEGIMGEPEEEIEAEFEADQED